ncbi:MAG: alcohol dehydrogenase catalytic domain-containing protein [Acidimicrobiia bacterium]|nr:alcohol dehydrogenase catalytic domain-containing protein [Acidimicrobiia bacterium]
MRAVRCTEAGVAVVDVAEPEGQGVLVEVASVGICGSDLHLVDMGPRPVTFGHEVGGTVDGRPVAICPVRYCGDCPSCRKGATSVCQLGSNTVVGIHRDGGMADRLIVEADCLVELPAGVAAADAWLVEPIAVGVHAFEALPLEPDMRVAIVGGGTVGLVAAALARHRGCEVDLVARHPHQQAAARRLGAGLEPSGKYDVAMDAAGTESAAREAIRLCRPGGWFVIAGIYWGDVTLPGLALTLKELKVLPVVYYGHVRGEREIDVAARLLGELGGLGEALVTHRFPLHRAAEAFATAADKASGAIKVLVEP